MMFGFAVILLLLSSITFFLGANLLKVCYSVAEDPPDDIPSYELFTKVVMNHNNIFSQCNTECSIRVYYVKML